MSKGKNKQYKEKVGDVIGPITIFKEVPAVVPVELTVYEKLDAKEKEVQLQIDTLTLEHKAQIKALKAKLKQIGAVRVQFIELDLAAGVPIPESVPIPA